MAGGLLGGIVGGAIGWFMGGPAGAYLGASLGAGLGVALFDVSTAVSNGTPQTCATNTATEGGAIPDLLGTSQISGNIIWEAPTRAIQVPTGRGGKKGGGKGGTKSTVGSSRSEYNYYKSWAVAVCQGPIDDLLTIWNEDKCVFSGRASRPSNGGGSSITLTDMGACRFYFGTNNQNADTLLPNDIAYHHTCYAVMDDCLLGNIDRVPSLRFVVRKAPAITEFPNSAIGRYDYNPAHAVYHVLHKQLGLPVGLMDLTAFLAAAATLSDEGLGISVLFDSFRTAQDYLTDILTHIDGMLRYDFSGQFSLLVMRRGAEPTALPQVDETMITEEPTIERKSWLSTTNEIKITYPLRSESGTVNDQTTWDQTIAGHSLGLNISPDNLTVTRISIVGGPPAWAAARANKGKSSGKWYFEITCHLAYFGYDGFFCGLGTVLANLNDYVGSDEHSWGYGAQGEWVPVPGGTDWVSGPIKHNGQCIVQGQYGGIGTYKFAVDIDAGNLWMGTVDGGWVGGGDPAAGTNPTATGLTGTLYPMASIHLPTASTVINCGTSAFAGTVPDGFIGWIYYTNPIDYTNSTYNLQDTANMDLQAREVSKQISLSYFQAVASVGQTADRMLKKEAYPAAAVSFKANRNVFRLQPGDLFNLNYAPQGIVHMVCRVTQWQEDELGKEEFTIDAREAVEYLSGIMDALTYWQAAGQGEGPIGLAEDMDNSITALAHVLNLEAPYALSGENLAVLAIAGRESPRELGFGFHLSLDNVSYRSAGTVWKYAVHGTLDAAYSADTFRIDDLVGLYVTFDNADSTLINTITRPEVLSGQHLAVIHGTETIAVQTINPVSGRQEHLTGILRGLVENQQGDHTGRGDFGIIGT
ncbi:MAG: hypothetical protein HQK55_15455, partial [Deltaproteobacteria bacterium]|nr:hypothetical protein [Deltaproteobacteria bacterium]